MGRFWSGQTGQTVNLLAQPSKVRILPGPQIKYSRREFFICMSGMYENRWFDCTNERIKRKFTFFFERLQYSTRSVILPGPPKRYFNIKYLFLCLIQKYTSVFGVLSMFPDATRS